MVDTFELLRRFRSAPQVHAAALGYAWIDGVPQPETKLLLFVDRKQPASRLSPVELLPRSWQAGRASLDVDVVESGEVRASAGRTAPGDPLWAARRRPLRAGHSFGLSHRVGTLGLVVESVLAPARPLLLVSSHVANRRPDGRRYSLFQPGGRDRQRCDDDTPVAEALRFTRLDPRRPNHTEAALAAPFGDVPIEQRHPLGPITGVAHALRLGMKLSKVSRTTGKGAGTVVATNWSGYVRYGRRRYPFAGQFLVAGLDGPVSLDGDSGAVWLAESTFGQDSVLHAAGMNNAGCRGGYFSVCSPMQTIFTRLQIALPPSARSPHARSKASEFTTR